MDRRTYRDGNPGWSEKPGPAQYVLPQVLEQKPMCFDPADGLQHPNRFLNEVTGNHRPRQCRQRRRYALGLSPESTHPLLSALVGHAYLTCRFRGRFQCFSAPQSRSQKRRYHNDRETQIRQYELGQQRHRPAACLAQIPPYSDHTVPTKLHDRPHVETVAHQSLLRFASWTCGRPTSIRFLD